MIAGLGFLAAAAMLDRARRAGLGMPALRTYDDVFPRFIDAARHVWGRSAEFVIPHITADKRDRPPKDSQGLPVHAALLVMGGRPRAIGDTIIRRAGAYGLLLNDSIYALPDDMIWRVLVHEAVHLGIPNHGEEFRRLVTAKGGVASGAGTESGGKLLAQKKVGARYKTVREFPADAEREATAWARAQSAAARAAGTPERWRLSWE